MAVRPEEWQHSFRLCGITKKRFRTTSGSGRHALMVLTLRLGQRWG